MRYIYGVNMRERISPYRRFLGWLRIDTRRMYCAATLMYKIHGLSKPKYLADLFRRYQPRGPRGENVRIGRFPLLARTLGCCLFKSSVYIFRIPCHHLCVISRQFPLLKPWSTSICVSSMDSLSVQTDGRGKCLMMW